MTTRAAAEAETVTAVIASVPNVKDGEWGSRQWRRIVVNYETLLHTAEPERSIIAFAVAEDRAGVLAIADFTLSREARQGFEQISALMHAAKAEHWTTCDLVIEPDGRYRFDFSYDPPYRLGGKLHDTRFDDYLSRYLAEKQ